MAMTKLLNLMSWGARTCWKGWPVKIIFLYIKIHEKTRKKTMQDVNDITLKTSQLYRAVIVYLIAMNVPPVIYYHYKCKGLVLPSVYKHAST